MRLYLVRHAQAEPGEPDELRRLTSAGRTAARELARRLVENDPPDVVLTSPLLRARETAEAIARAAGVEAEPDERLAPGATSEDVLEVIAGRGAHIVVVGHQPDCGLIAAELLDGAAPPFPPAGLVELDLD